jgi:hypothetical protein
MLRGFYLTLLVGPVVPAPAPQPVMDALMSAQVTTSAGQASGFQLTFAISKKSLLANAMLPAGYFDPKIRIILVATIGGVPTVLMDGIITQQTVTPSNEPGQSTLTVTGEDLSLLMDLEEKTQCYPALPPNARVALMCLNYLIYGIIPVPIPAIQMDIPNPLERIPLQTSTDLNYAKSLAQENGYVFYIEPGPVPGASLAYWGPEIRVGIPQPALSVNMDADTNVESLSFTYDGLAKQQMTIEILDPIFKQPIPIPVPDIGILRPPLALRPALPLKRGPLPDSSKWDTVHALLMGLSQTAEASDSISGNGQLDVLRYGHILKARRLVSVRGAGLAYDGFYYVKSVTHNIKRGEYKQSFTLGRDGLLPLTPRVMP